MKPSRQLTEEMLDEFVQHKGDMRAYVESGRGPLSFDWDRIDELLQRIFLVRADLASAAFRASVEDELGAISSDEGVRRRLWDIAGDRVVATHGNVVV
jgi:hypothetical protein